MILIGISGKLGSGKNYIAEKILPEILTKLLPKGRLFQLAFGDQVKVELATRNPQLSFESLFVEKSKETRQMLQVYGTEICRKQYGEDIWIRGLNTWIQIIRSRMHLHETPVFIISDVRFKNEVDWISGQGGHIFRVHAPQRNKERLLAENSTDLENHRSETELDSYSFEHTIENDPHQSHDLYSRVYTTVCKALTLNSLHK